MEKIINYEMILFLILVASIVGFTIDKIKRFFYYKTLLYQILLPSLAFLAGTIMCYEFYSNSNEVLFVPFGIITNSIIGGILTMGGSAKLMDFFNLLKGDLLRLKNNIDDLSTDDIYQKLVERGSAEDANAEYDVVEVEV